MEQKYSAPPDKIFALLTDPNGSKPAAWRWAS